MFISMPALMDGHHRLVIIGVHLGDPVPVRDDKTLETKFALEHVRQQILVGMHLYPVPTAERGHHAHRPRIHRRLVGWQE